MQEKGDALLGALFDARGVGVDLRTVWRAPLIHVRPRPASTKEQCVGNAIIIISKCLVLTHCNLVMPYGDIDLDDIGSGIGLLPDGTKQLPACVTLWRHVRKGPKGKPSFSQRTVDMCAQFWRFID